MFDPFFRYCRRKLPAIAGVLTLLAAVQPGSAAAYTIPEPNFSADQARAIFLDAGYSVGQLETWDWLTPSVVTFQVNDVAQHNVLLVQVYPDVAQAQVGSERMVEGYSASTWINNLAVFEADANEYQQVEAAALARSVGMVQADSVPSASLRSTRVDTQYTQLILNAMNAMDPRL